MGKTIRHSKLYKGKKPIKKYKNNNRGLKGSVKNLNTEYEYGSFEKFGDKKR